MALIEALICYILYVVVVLLYYQYYIGKCKCFTRAQLGKARAVIAALRGRVAHARARLCNETRNPAFVLPGRQHAAPPALLRLAASPRLRFRRCGGGGRESHIKRRQSARLALSSHAASRRSCWHGRAAVCWGLMDLQHWQCFWSVLVMSGNGFVKVD